MTYTELKQAIQDFASNAEPSFLAHIDEFIVMTEKRILQDAALPLEQNSTILTTTPGAAELLLTSIPNWLSVDSLAVNVGGTYAYLDNKDEEYLRMAFPTITATGKPRIYCVYDVNTLKLAPTPDIVYNVEMRYRTYPESITTTGTTTWLSTTFEYALLYGAMRDAAVYLKEEADVVAMYEAKYAEALQQIMTFNETRASLDVYRKRNA
jgi:hypothetical protein